MDNQITPVQNQATHAVDESKEVRYGYTPLKPIRKGYETLAMIQKQQRQYAEENASFVHHSTPVIYDPIEWDSRLRKQQ